MPKGGPRPGAGRPKKAKLYENPIRQAEDKIKDRLPWVVDKLFELAEGVWVESTEIEGARVVYQKPPDRQACEYLMDRIMGKPTQPVEFRERARQIADELGWTVDEVVAEAQRVASGKP